MRHSLGPRSRHMFNMIGISVLSGLLISKGRKSPWIGILGFFQSSFNGLDISVLGRLMVIRSWEMLSLIIISVSDIVRLRCIRSIKTSQCMESLPMAVEVQSIPINSVAAINVFHVGVLFRLDVSVADIASNSILHGRSSMVAYISSDSILDSIINSSTHTPGFITAPTNLFLEMWPSRRSQSLITTVLMLTRSSNSCFFKVINKHVGNFLSFSQKKRLMSIFVFVLKFEIETVFSLWARSCHYFYSCRQRC